MIKRKQKFNNGMGAILCNHCSKIIETGLSSNALFCEKCDVITEDILKKLGFKKGFSNANVDMYYIKEKHEEIEIAFEKFYTRPGFFLNSINNNRVTIKLLNTTHLSYLINFIKYERPS